jgi:predicted RNA-binding Zn ribbon-like protein
MEDELRDGFKFRGDRLALDFTATLGGRRRAEPTELLAEPHDLGRWLVAARLASRSPPVTPAELDGARELREAIYALARARVDGRPLAAADRAVVNRWAKLPARVPQLAADGTIAWSGNGAGLLATIARDAIELFGGSRADRIRACSGEGCAIVFFDASRAGERRWCSMASCGNKAKVRRFRRG